jgi:diacylglycerol O-acyltransferase / trehalose O-mycolyltransferase
MTDTFPKRADCTRATATSTTVTPPLYEIRLNSLTIRVIPDAVSSCTIADPLVDTLQPVDTAAAPDGSRLKKITVSDARTVFATSMQRSVSVRVQRPADTSQPRATLYLLDGETRRQLTDAMTFLADKNVNVVIPTGGENAYWTDWAAADPKLGVNMWRTFLTQELPPVVDAALGTNGINAIAGMSRTGTAALQLAMPSLACSRP